MFIRQTQALARGA